MTVEELLRSKRDEILRIAAKRGARNVRVFGSAARGEADGASDIDLLVDLEPGRSLLDHTELILDLQELLGHKVDVLTENSIYWLLRRRILREARPL
ncbi:MAG: nucleotidyltransferase family protein [Candidatus Methylomirabilales bacterium]